MNINNYNEGGYYFHSGTVFAGSIFWNPSGSSHATAHTFGESGKETFVNEQNKGVLIVECPYCTNLNKMKDLHCKSCGGSLKDAKPVRYINE